MKKKLVFLCSLCALTLVLFVFKSRVAGFYDSILLDATSLLLPEEKRTFEVYQLVLSISQKTSVSIIVLFSLLATTPKIRLRRRGGIFAAGFVAFVFFDLLSLLFWPDQAPGQCVGGAVDNPYVSNIFIRDFFTHWVFPLLLWLVAVHKNIGDLFATPPPPEESQLTQGRCPLCGRKKKGVLAHIRDMHGEAEMENTLVKRYIAAFGDDASGS